MHRIYNMSTYLQNVPEMVYKNSGWFFFISNELEMDRIKAETAAAVNRATQASMRMAKTRETMSQRFRLPTR